MANKRLSIISLIVGVVALVLSGCLLILFIFNYPVRRILTKNVWRITLKKTYVSSSFKDLGGGPDIRVVVYLNGRPLFDTHTSQYSRWYEGIAGNVYKVNWFDNLPIFDLNGDGKIDSEERDWTKQARSGLSMEFEFGLGNELAIELWDRDVDEDDLIASWRVDNPLELANLISGDSYVSFEVKKLKELPQKVGE